MKVRILCCIDDGEPAALALVTAIQLACKLNAFLTLLSVNPLLPGRGAPICLRPEPYVSELLEAAARKARWAGLTHVEQDRCHALDVAEAIVAHAEEGEVDYIVLGTRDRSGVARALGGSVSRSVIAKANCPVIAVRRIREQHRTRSKGGLREPNVLHEPPPQPVDRRFEAPEGGVC